MVFPKPFTNTLGRKKLFCSFLKLSKQETNHSLRKMLVQENETSRGEKKQTKVQSTWTMFQYCSQFVYFTHRHKFHLNFHKHLMEWVSSSDFQFVWLVGSELNRSFCQLHGNLHPLLCSQVEFVGSRQELNRFVDHWKLYWIIEDYRL